MKNQPEQLIKIPIVAFIVTAVYTASTIIANILSVKMILLPFIFPFNTVDAGAIIFPLSFIMRDMLHKNAGKTVTTVVVVTVSTITLSITALFYLTSILPAPEIWKNSGHLEAFNLILIPTGRIALASVISQIISGLVNTCIFSKIIRKNPLKKDISASSISNILTSVVDSTLFTLIAFSFSYISTKEIISIIIVNIFFKWIIILLGTPLIRLIKIEVHQDLL